MADGQVVFTTALDTTGLKNDLSRLNGTSGEGSLLSSMGGAASFSKIGTKLGKTIGVAAALEIAKAIGETGMAFDTAMSQVAATLGTTVRNIPELKELAEISGRTTAYTAVEAAEAINYMAQAGWDTQTILETFPAMLELAAAGSLDLAYASDVVTDGITAMGLTAEDTGRFVDEMAQTAVKTNLSVSQLAGAMLQIGATAQEMSGGTTELNTALGLLADNGIKARQGGTQLRNILLSLSSPTEKAAEAMERIGLEAYDADGNFRPLIDIFGDLRQSLAGMTQEEKNLTLDEMFNRTDMKSVNALLGTTTERWRQLEGYIKDSEGAAGRMAEVKLDNLGGDIIKFKSAVEGLKLGVYRPFESGARSAVQLGTTAVNAINDAFFDEKKWDAFSEKLGLAEETAVRISETGMEFGASGAGKSFEQKKSWFDSFVDFFIPSAGAEEMPPEMAAIADAYAENMTTSMQTAMQEHAPQLQKGVYDAFSQPVDVNGEFGSVSMEGNPVEAIAQSIVSSLAGGITNSFESVSVALDSGLASAEANADVSGFTGVGENIASGIAAGISSGAGEVASAVRKLIEMALETAKKAGEIRSPSRLFRDEVGEMIAAGAAEGIEGGSEWVRNAALAMVNETAKDIKFAPVYDLSNIAASAAIAASPAWSRGTGAKASEVNQTINFNVPVQTPDEFADTVRMFSTYGLEALG